MGNAQHPVEALSCRRRAVCADRRLPRAARTAAAGAAHPGAASTRSPSSAPTVPSRATRSSAAQRSACGCSEPASRGLQGSRSSATPPRSTPKLERMRQRVGVAPDPSLDKMAARIRTETITLDAPASRPMDDARLEAKLRSLAGARAPDLLERCARWRRFHGFASLKRIVFRRAALGAGGTARFSSPKRGFCHLRIS